jgi:hypothetical protein
MSGWSLLFYLDKSRYSTMEIYRNCNYVGTSSIISDANDDEGKRFKSNIFSCVSAAGD